MSSLYTSLERNLIPWYRQILKHISNVKIEIPFATFTLHKKEKPLLNPSKELFNLLARNIPTYNPSKKHKCPVLFIDEANKMYQLTKTAEGRLALADLLEFFILCTKQNGRFHVVLGSSDSFFNRWLEHYIGLDRYQVRVVGNLSKDEARKYWEEHAFKNLEDPTLPKPSFDDAFSVCGGNIMLLERYIAEYQDDPNMLPGGFSGVKNATTRLSKALTDNSAPWNKNQELYQLVTRLVQSRDGYLLYRNVRKEFGDKYGNGSERNVVDMMIEAKLLHMRPVRSSSGDIKGNPDVSIITAESQPSAVAMKNIIDSGEYAMNK